MADRSPRGRALEGPTSAAAALLETPPLPDAPLQPPTALRLPPTSLAGRGWLSVLWLAAIWLAVIGLLYLALRGIPLPQILATLSRLNSGQVLVLAAVNLGILVLMAVRWWVLLRALGARVGPGKLFLYRLAGFGVSYFTPGPQFGGEPVQVHLLHKRGAVPLATAISSVFIDRLVDLLANFTFLMFGVVVVLLTGLVKGAVWSALPFALAGLLLLPLAHLAALWAGRRPLSWLAQRIAVRWPLLNRAAVVTGQSEEQIGQFCRSRPVALLSVIALSALLWVVNVFEFWLTLRLLGVDTGVINTISALTAARLAFLLPLPGGLGALEASQVMAAQLLGWGAAVGIGVSLIIRARDVFFALLGLLVGGTAFFDRRFLRRQASKPLDAE